MKRPVIAVVALAVATLVGCGQRPDARSSPNPAGSPTPGKPIPGGLGAFTSGSAHFDVTGSQEDSADLDIVAQSTVATEDTVLLFYTDVQAGAVLQIGDTPGGLSVGFATATVSAVGGEPNCSVDFAERSEDRVEGTFTCTDLTNQIGEQGPIEVTGTFDASA